MRRFNGNGIQIDTISPISAYLLINIFVAIIVV